MVRKSVTSSRISSVGWENNVLEVQFKKGDVYHYLNVSEDEYRRFMASPSLGSALSKLDKKHNFHRV